VRTAPTGLWQRAHPQTIPASPGVVEIHAKEKPGSVHPDWPGQWKRRTQQCVYFPSEMLKSTELPLSPKAAIVTVLVPWNKADEMSIFLAFPSES